MTIYLMCIYKPSLGPRGPKSTFREKVLVLKSCGELIAMVALVLGGLIIGWFTPTEAGAIGSGGRHPLYNDSRKDDLEEICRGPSWKP